MSEILTWDKSIDKKVKTADKKSLGRIKAITNDFIQVEKGSLGKKYYFIPKYYIEGYDGKHVWVSMTKDESDEFRSEEEVSKDYFTNEKYKERKSSVENKHSDFSTAIPSYHSPSSAEVDKIGMPWEEIIGEDVKSSDDKDVGEVSSVAGDYIEVKKGTINKKSYYIPKIHLAEYDGDDVRTRLTKDEIKDRFEGDSPPLSSEFQSAEYNELSEKYGTSYPRYRELIPMMSREPGLELRDETKVPLKIPWEEVIHKHVMATDNVDIGDVDKVGNEFLVVRDGVVNTHMYYVPKQYIERYDGSSIWISEPSALISSKFEREHEPTQDEMDLLVQEAKNKIQPNRC